MHRCVRKPLQGVRIDYALVSAGLLGRVASCEILGGLPPKWSDHAPLLLELADIPAVPLHPPCALSSKRMKRFQVRRRVHKAAGYTSTPFH